jgi:hypothetical protein
VDARFARFANATVAHAREAERQLLIDIYAASVHMTNTPAHYGAYRDLKSAVLGAVEEVRERIRDRTVPLQAVFPAYVPGLLAVDLTRQQPGDPAWSATVAQMRTTSHHGV